MASCLSGVIIIRGQSLGGRHPRAHSPGWPLGLILSTTRWPHRRCHVLYSTKSFGLSSLRLRLPLRVTSPGKMMIGFPRPIEDERVPSPHRGWTGSLAPWRMNGLPRPMEDDRAPSSHGGWTGSLVPWRMIGLPRLIRALIGSISILSLTPW